MFFDCKWGTAMAAGTTMTGTVIGYNGAVSMGANSILDGRLFSNVGAVSIYGTQATIPAKVAAAEILIPTVTSQSTTNTSYYCRNLGGSMLGDDTLLQSTELHSEEIYINNENWSLTIYYPELVPGTYEVVATTNRTSNNKTSTDATNSELVILDTADPTTVTSANDGGLESNGDLASLIANRNFNKKTNSFVNKKEAQKKFTPNSILLKQ
jgi:hypothetical protein